MTIIVTPHDKVSAIGRVYTQTWKNGSGFWSWEVVSANGQLIARHHDAMTHAIAEREAKRVYGAVTATKPEPDLKS